MNKRNLSKRTEMKGHRMRSGFVSAAVPQAEAEATTPAATTPAAH